MLVDDAGWDGGAHPPAELDRLAVGLCPLPSLVAVADGDAGDDPVIDAEDEVDAEDEDDADVEDPGLWPERGKVGLDALLPVGAGQVGCVVVAVADEDGPEVDRVELVVDDGVDGAAGDEGVVRVVADDAVGLGDEADAVGDAE